MLTRAQVQRYAFDSGLRDMMIAEKEVVLTFLLQLLSERGLLARLAFKGGTCLRKMLVGSQGRFSTDLDFTGIEEHDHEDVILDLMAAFEQPFHGIQLSIPDESYYETVDGLSWGVNPAYVHDWNGGGSEIKLQISRRETPTLPTESRPQNWDDLTQLLRRTMAIDRRRITADCVDGFAFLRELTDEERVLAADPYRREHELWRRLSTAKAEP